MRYLFAKAIISLLAFAYASADDVRVYMFDSEPLSPQPRNYEVSPGAARLLLSRRLTPSDTSLLGQVDEKLVKCMNEFGGQQSALLSTLDTIDDVSRLLVVWEGAEAYSVASNSNPFWSSFVVPHAPDDLIDGLFIENLLDHGSSISSRSKLCSYDFGADDKLFIRLPRGRGCVSWDSLRPSKSKPNALNEKELISFLSQGVASWIGQPATSILLIKSETKSAMIDNIIHMVFTELVALASESKQETTVVLLSRQHPKNFSQNKPHLKPPYESDNQDLVHSSSSMKSGCPRGVALLSPRHQPDIPSSLIPICHVSNSSCGRATLSCPVDGDCYPKYGAKGILASKESYACQQHKPQKRRNMDGTIKTAEWDSVASQKVDVSTSFFILAGISLLLLTVISWGITLLFGIGQEELPSVLSAGVAAHRSQK